MKEIGKVKLGLNKVLEVVIESDITMNDENDKDDLYFVMFNIMYQPLRLAIITVGDLLSLAKENTDMSETDLLSLLSTSPEEYVFVALGDGKRMMENGVEKIKIPLDSQDNADKARVILSSMIDRGHFIQKSNYRVGKEVIAKEQKVTTGDMNEQLRLMLEIVKRWNNLDLEELAKLMG